MNVNGGRTCTMTQAAGYAAPKNVGTDGLLVSGIADRSCFPWPDFYYDDDDLVEAVVMLKFTAYNPVGIIKQVAACRLNYKGKNAAGGRKCNGLGAASRSPKTWESGIEGNQGDIRVRLVIDDGVIAMGPESDLSWLALRLRRQLGERLEQ